MEVKHRDNEIRRKLVELLLWLDLETFAKLFDSDEKCIFIKNETKDYSA